MVRIGLVASSALIAVAPVYAQNAPMATHLRGAIVSRSGNVLTLKSRDGRLAAVTLADGWTISSVGRASLASIKPGDFVGIASLPKGAGDRALEVLIFPPALKGTGEGSYGWDLKPHSSMTNASVSSLVKGVSGRTVTLSYGSGQQKTIAIPQNTPVVTIAPATPADLKPGAAVFLASTVIGGKLTTKHVVVGKDGVVPPM